MPCEPNGNLSDSPALCACQPLCRLPTVGWSGESAQQWCSGMALSVHADETALELFRRANRKPLRTGLAFFDEVRRPRTRP